MIAKAIALVALITAATILEMNGHEASGLWIVVVLWMLFGEWGTTTNSDE